MTLPASLPHVLGADLSLTASAFAWPDATTQTHGRAGLTAVSTPLAERAGLLGTLATELDQITRSRRVLWDHRPPVLVAVEGLPTSGTKVNSERCYLWWEFVRLVTGYGTPVLAIPPTTIKLYATGMGNANKREVIAAVKRDLPSWEVCKTSKTGKVLTTDDDDKADAVWIMAIGCHLVGRPLVEVTPWRERALEKLILPEGVSRG